MGVLNGARDKGVYVEGELLKVLDRTRRDNGVVKYYVQLLIDDEPGVVQVNVTDLTPSEIREISGLGRLSAVSFRVRVFAMEGTAYFKALEYIPLSADDEE